MFWMSFLFVLGIAVPLNWTKCGRCAASTHTLLPGVARIWSCLTLLWAPYSPSCSACTCNSCHVWWEGRGIVLEENQALPASPCFSGTFCSLWLSGSKGRGVRSVHWWLINFYWVKVARVVILECHILFFWVTEVACTLCPLGWPSDSCIPWPAFGTSKHSEGAGTIFSKSLGICATNGLATAPRTQPPWSFRISTLNSLSLPLDSIMTITVIRCTQFQKFQKYRQSILFESVVESDTSGCCTGKWTLNGLTAAQGL